MAAISDYLANALLNQIFRGAAAPTITAIYWALMTGASNHEAAGAEATGGGYARQNLAPGAGNYNASSSGVTWNSKKISWPNPSADQGTIVEVATFDASSNGNMLTFAPISPTQPSNTTTGPYVLQSTNARFKMGGGGGSVASGTSAWSDYAADALNNQIFRSAAALAPSALYYALVTAEPNHESTGATITEPSGNGYARVQLNPGTANYNAAASGVTWNLVAVNFSGATGSWGRPIGAALCDSGSVGGGNILAFAPINPTKLVFSNAIWFLPGSLRFRLGGGGGGPP